MHAAKSHDNETHCRPKKLWWVRLARSTVSKKVLKKTTITKAQHAPRYNNQRRKYLGVAPRNGTTCHYEKTFVSVAGADTERLRHRHRHLHQHQHTTHTQHTNKQTNKQTCMHAYIHSYIHTYNHVVTRFWHYLVERPGSLKKKSRTSSDSGANNEKNHNKNEAVHSARTKP